MNIKEIKEYSRDTRIDILRIAESIHPKLLSVIQYKDIYDDSLLDNSLKTRFDEQIKPNVLDYYDELKRLKQDYLTQFFEDFMEVSEFDDYGIDISTGSWLYNPSAWTTMQVEFLPRVEIQAMYEGVMDIHSSKNTFTPFWERNGYTMISDHEKATVFGRTTPREFIMGCRMMFNQHHRNGIYKVLDSAKLANTFDYDLHLEPLTQYDERNIANNIIVSSVHRHAKLRDFLESTIDKNLQFYTSTYNGMKYTFRGPQ